MEFQEQTPKEGILMNIGWNYFLIKQKMGIDRDHLLDGIVQSVIGINVIFRESFTKTKYLFLELLEL